MEFPGPHLPPKPQRGSKALAHWNCLKSEHDAAFAKWASEERARVARQRELFAANLGPARAALQAAMLDRAWFLLDCCEAEAADALLEFVPEVAADKLLDEFFNDGSESVPPDHLEHGGDG